MDYENIIKTASQDGDLLDVLKALQAEESYLSEDAIRAAARAYNTTPNEVYETASFYTMLRLKKGTKHSIQVCGSTCCDVQKGNALCRKLSELHIADTEISRCECLGQCNTAPNAVVDGTLVLNADVESILKALEEGGAE